MKKARRRKASGELRSHYDFSGGVQGKYAGRLDRDAILVVLEPDVAKVFQTSESVNKALRALLDIVPSKKRRKAS
jgi:hypothetical protein